MAMAVLATVVRRITRGSNISRLPARPRTRHTFADRGRARTGAAGGQDLQRGINPAWRFHRVLAAAAPLAGVSVIGDVISP